MKKIALITLFFMMAGILHAADLRTTLNEQLFIEAEKGNITAICSLIEHGANVNAINQAYNNETIDYLAEIQSRKPIIHALLTCDELAMANDPERDPEFPAFPPELIGRVLRPLIKAKIIEDLVPSLQGN